MDRLVGQIVDKIRNFLFDQRATVFRTNERDGAVNVDFRVESSTGVRIYRLSLTRIS